MQLFTHFYFVMVLKKMDKNHYQKLESKDENNENIGSGESGCDDGDENPKNNFKEDGNVTIFRSGIKYNIDNVMVMTTINSFENNTIYLGLNNEKI